MTKEQIDANVLVAIHATMMIVMLIAKGVIVTTSHMITIMSARNIDERLAKSVYRTWIDKEAYFYKAGSGITKPVGGDNY